MVTHGEPLALENREQALLVPDLVISKSEAFPLICVPIQFNGKAIGALQSNFLSLARHEELMPKQYVLKLAADLIGYVIENTTLRRKLQEMKGVELSQRKPPRINAPDDVISQLVRISREEVTHNKVAI